MAEGRMLRKKITTDEKVRTLSLKSAFLYTWLLPFQDREGKFFATPSIIKGQIVPYRQEYTLRNIPFFLKEIETSGLITIYGKDREYMQFNGFLKNNNVHKNEAKSHIPDAPMSRHCSDIGETLQSINEMKGINSVDQKTSTAHKPLGSEAKILLDYFFTEYLKHRNVKYLVNGAKDMKLLKTLLKDLPFDKIKELIDIFFVSGDSFIVSSDYSIGVFYSQRNKLQQKQPFVPKYEAFK